MSDIDIDLFFPRSATLRTQQVTLQRFLILKYFIPLFSEVNIYTEDTIDFIDDCINPLELQRDPQLIKVGNLSPVIPTRTEQLVYVIKMLCSDRHNLISHLNLRKKKWAFHLKQLHLDKKIEPFNLTNLLNVLEKHLFIHFPRIAIKKTLHQYLKQKKNLASFSSFNEKKNYFLLFPNEFIFHVASSESSLLKMFSSLNEEEQVLYIDQLKWELWGLYTQYKIINNISTLNTHLKSLAKTIDYLDTNFSFLKEKFHFLMGLVDQWECSIKESSYRENYH